MAYTAPLQLLRYVTRELTVERSQSRALSCCRKARNSTLTAQETPDGAHEVKCYKLGLTCLSLLHLVSTQASSTQLHYLRAPEGA